MINALTEFEKITKDRTILCAELMWDEEYDVETGVSTFMGAALLPAGYSCGNLFRFLDHLNFGYDNGYGGQYLFGTIWFTDGTWATRGEYDGSEWWQIHIRPNVPEYLGGK